MSRATTLRDALVRCGRACMLLAAARAPATSRTALAECEAAGRALRTAMDAVRGAVR